MDMHAAREAFERDGFVNGGMILTASEVAALADELESCVAGCFHGESTEQTLPSIANNLTKSEGDDLYQLNNLFEFSENYQKLVSHPVLVERAAFLARSQTLQVWTEQVMHKPPRNGAFLRWHQDGHHHAQSITPPTSFIAAWVALDDCDEDSGCMWMVPGSHRWGEQESHLFRWRFRGEVEDFEAVHPHKDDLQAQREWTGPRACPVRAGEVHFHHPLTWHGSASNRSDRPRRADAIHYMTDGACLADPPDERVPLQVGDALLLADSKKFPLVFPLKALM